MPPVPSAVKAQFLSMCVYIYMMYSNAKKRRPQDVACAPCPIFRGVGGNVTILVVVFFCFVHLLREQIVFNL